MLHCEAKHPHSHLNNLDNHKVAVLKHFRYPGLEKLAEEGRIELHPVKSYEQGIKMVELGRVDGFVEMDTRLRFNLNQHIKTSPDAPYRTIESIGDLVPEYDLYLVVNFNMKDKLRRAINDAYTKLKQTGFVEKTIKKYTHTN